MSSFKVISEITTVETIAIGNAIREINRLRKQYGSGHWRKLKGNAIICLADGKVRKAEIHWYEAHGIGKKEFKRKRYLE